MKAKLRVLLTVSALLLPALSSASVFVSVNIAPPALPVYEQPYCPGDGYIWVPGYWAYGDDGYYWVPGVWVLPPQVGYLWTPGYWAWERDVYYFHPGYWGPHVGFYGGINYGYGYTGVGYWGGRWEGSVFRYNTAVTRVNVVNIHNTYNTTVVNNVTVNRVSYNGGGGTHARPTAQEDQALHDRHDAPTPDQGRHEREARDDRGQWASNNHGQPARTVSTRPGDRGPDRGGPDHGRDGNGPGPSRDNNNRFGQNRDDAGRPDRADRPGNDNNATGRGRWQGNNDARPDRRDDNGPGTSGGFGTARPDSTPGNDSTPSRPDRPQGGADADRGQRRGGGRHRADGMSATPGAAAQPQPAHQEAMPQGMPAGGAQPQQRPQPMHGGGGGPRMGGPGPQQQGGEGPRQHGERGGGGGHGGGRRDRDG